MHHARAVRAATIGPISSCITLRAPSRIQMGPRLTACLGALMMGGGVIAASSATSLGAFALFYAAMFGVGVGVCNGI